VNVTNTVIVNRTVINNVNVTNVNYVNRNVAGAVTVMPQSAMTVGRPVAAAAVRVTPDVVSRAEVRNVAVVAPERAAVLGGRVQTSAAPPPSFTSRTVVARQAPPAPTPSFAQQQQALRQNPGQPIPRSSFAQIQQQRGAVQGGNPQPAVRQVGPPATTPAQAVRPIQPAPQATPQPEIRRQPNPQPAPQRQPAAPTEQPEVRRSPVPQQQPQSQPPPRQQTQPTTPQSGSQPEIRRGTPPSGTPQREAPQGNEKQKGRQEKQDGKRHDEKN
jgi:hypothetical protein